MIDKREPKRCRHVGSVHSGMRVKVPGSFAALIYVIVIILSLGLSSVVHAEAPADNDSPAELGRQIQDFYREGKFKEAIPLVEKLVDLSKRAKGDEDPDTATGLNNLAMLYGQMGDYAKAEPLYQQALAIRRKVLSPDNLDVAATLNSLGCLYTSLGDYAKAEPLIEQALSIRQRVRGTEDPDTANSLDNLGVVYANRREYGKAESLYQQALAIRQRILGAEHPDTAVTLNNLGLLYASQGNYSKAEPLYQQALAIRRKAFCPEHPQTIASIDNLAGLYESTGEFNKAESLYQQALETRQKTLGPEHADTIASLNRLGALDFKTGNYIKAEPLFQQALQLRQKTVGPEYPDTADAITNLAFLYFETGDFEKAQALFREALQILEKVRGPDHPDTAASLSNLAILYINLRDYANAEPLLQRALEIERRTLSADHPATAATNLYLARLYFEEGEYKKAEPFAMQALEMTKRVFGPEHPRTTGLLDTLAAIHIKLEDYAKAEPLLEEALEIQRKTLGSHHRLTAVSLYNLAGVYYGMGDSAKAESLLEQVRQIWLKSFGSEHPFTLRNLGDLASMKIELGELEEAKRLARLEANDESVLVAKIFAFASEQQRLGFLNEFNPYHLFAKLKGSEPELAAAALHYKGVVLDSVIEDRRIAEASRESGNQKLVEDLDATKQQLGKLLLQTPQQASLETTNRIRQLEEAADQKENELATYVAGLGLARRAAAVTVEQIQSVIPNDVALVEYVRYAHDLGKFKSEPRYAAIVVCSKGLPLWIPLAKADEIEALVRRSQKLVRGSPNDDELGSNLRALYDALWAPIGKYLVSGIKQLIISPDGQLNFVSFATLVSPSSEFLAEEFIIQYVASGRDLLLPTQTSTSKKAVVFFNPDFRATPGGALAKAGGQISDQSLPRLRGTDRRDMEDLRFDPLAGTQKEGDGLVQDFKSWGCQTIASNRARATKAALLQIHSPYILHLATHGFFELEDPSEAYPEPWQLLSAEPNVMKSKFFKNPMHRSGLALAGAETTLEAWKRGEVPPIESDGIVTAEDISILDLKGTWLVTLSACDTGSGEARAGEGVMGLRRGFIEAGAQNLLMPLWPISDDTTVEIMKDFYEEAHTSGDAPEALAEVQRNWLVKLRKEQGLAKAVNLAGPFIISSQGKPSPAKAVIERAQK